MSRTLVLSSIVLCAALAVLSGCQQCARIDWDKPEVACQDATPLYVGELCVDKRGGGIWGSGAEGESIGKHTFTVFAIPVGNINAHPDTPLKPSIDRAMREALTAAGYDLLQLR